MLMKIWGSIYHARKKVWVQLMRGWQSKLRSFTLHLWFQNFILPLDEKTKNQLKIAERQNTALWVINFLLFNFGIFSYRQRVISKHLKLVLAYVSWANNRKFTAIFLTMKPLICKFWILIHNNDFSIGILFWYISVTFSKKIWWTFFKNNFFGLL